jgi:hypothetical protein
VRHVPAQIRPLKIIEKEGSMPTPLAKSIREILAEKHPELHADQLKEGENVLLKEKDGTKYVAMVSKGKIDGLAVFDANGKQGTMVRIEPPPPAKPDPVSPAEGRFLGAVLVCMCAPVSTQYGDGVRCWWVNEDDPYK